MLIAVFNAPKPVEWKADDAAHIASQRAHVAMLTDRELLLLALFRALETDRQREIGGTLYRLATNNEAALRFRTEAAALGVEHLPASVLKPFMGAVDPCRLEG